MRHAIMRLFSVNADSASEMVRNASLEFVKTDLVKLIQIAAWSVERKWFCSV